MGSTQMAPHAASPTGLAAGSPNVRMQRSGRDKVQVETAAAGR
jgi:hypothetical protein